MADYVYLVHPQHPSSSRVRGHHPESYRNSRTEGGSVLWRCVAHFLSVASNLNDDRLGRVLDKLFEAGLTELFVGVASKAAERFALPEPRSVHLDATSFHLHGCYDDEETDDDEGRELEEIR